MNGDKLFRLLMVLCLAMGIMGLTVGKFILGGIFVGLAVAIWLTTGGKHYNDRNIYDKIVEGCEDVTIEHVYECLSKMDTCLRFPWMGHNTYTSEAVINLGPSPFKDFITIYKDKKNNIVIKSSTELEHLVRDADSEDHFEGLLDTKSMSVNPKSYSHFASWKLMSAVLVEDLTEIIKQIKDGDPLEVKTLDMFKFFYANSKDCLYRDFDDNEYTYVRTVNEPLNVKIYEIPEGGEAIEESGEVLAEVTGSSKAEKNGFKFSMSGEGYGTLYRDTESDSDSYILETNDGSVYVKGFRAVRKANLSCNYIITIDGVRKAVIAGNARIAFEEDALTENSLICSLDDEYLLLYMAILEMIMTKNKWLK
ncbi:hypothetical protein [Mogibacterium pumilum]|uniref:Uncharacterized protein n=1 Tax=Mogibacterium pumilum TaxID=86332 RepID=A0A223AS70_9FIRM|nr:hypothetical protein [Mogibacterium pumilum]ASS37787.1 hypothetical protein AXF17_04535 [Mogibacterium pumilum]